MRRQASAMVTFVITASLIAAIGVAYGLAVQHISSLRPTAWDSALKIHNAVEILQKPPQSVGKSITVELFLPEDSTLSIVKRNKGFMLVVSGAYGDLSYRFRDPADVLADSPIEISDGVLRVFYEGVEVVAGDVASASGDNVITLSPGRHAIVLTLVDLNVIRVDEARGGFGVEA